MKFEFESDGDVPLGEALNTPSMIIVTASASEKDGKHYI